MCGIAGIHRLTKGPIRRGEKLANELLLAIENRGTDATGHLTITDRGRVTIEKMIVPARVYVKAGGVSMKGNPRTTLLHTRFATVGEITTANAHPVVNGPLAAIHNGTIYNHREVFKKTGRERNATVDSEVIPAAVAHYGWDNAAEALGKLSGGAATALVDTKNPGALLLARLSGYPLVMMVSKSLIVWGSTREAIERAWKKTYGTVPNACQWITVPEFTLIRVTPMGEITVEKIDRDPVPEFPRGGYGHRRVGSDGRWPHSKGKANPPKKRFVERSVHTNEPAKKKRAKKAGRGQMTIPATPTASTATPPTFDMDEPFVSNAIADLQRQGATRAEAEEMVLGYSVTPDVEEPDEDGIGCPECHVGTIDVRPGGACWYCGLTFEACADAADWIERNA